MPLYEFSCLTCHKDLSLTMSVNDREQGPKCPDCGARLEPRLTAFYSKTAKKS